MKAAVIAAVLLGAGAAQAAPGNIVDAPAGWRADPEQASALAQRLVAAPHALPTQSAVEAYAHDGVALIATRMTITLPSEGREAAQAGAIRAALDELRGEPKRATLAGGHAAERSWDESVDAANKQVVAMLLWADDASKALVSASGRIASDGAKLAIATAECIATEASNQATVMACHRAIASLDPGIALAQRVALAVPAASAPPPPAAPAPSSNASMAAPPSLSDGTHIVLPPQHVPLPPPEPDRRPVYVGFGVVMLAAMFWWNRRRRDRFEREDDREARPRRRERVTVDAQRLDRDDDADDLHAAARGGRPEDDA